MTKKKQHLQKQELYRAATQKNVLIGFIVLVIILGIGLFAVKSIYSMSSSLVAIHKTDFFKTAMVQDIATEGAKTSLLTPIATLSATPYPAPTTHTVPATEVGTNIMPVSNVVYAQKNDSFWKITKRFCGTGKYYKSVKRYNGYGKKSTLRAGDPITVVCNY